VRPEQAAVVESLGELRDLCLSESPSMRPLFGDITGLLASHLPSAECESRAPADPEQAALRVDGRHWSGDGADGTDFGVPGVV